MSTFPRGHNGRRQLEQNQRLIARISGVIHDHATITISRRFEFPNPTDLRGIPVIGPGVTGTIPGTRPDAVR